MKPVVVSIAANLVVARASAFTHSLDMTHRLDVRQESPKPKERLDWKIDDFYTQCYHKVNSLERAFNEEIRRSMQDVVRLHTDYFYINDERIVIPNGADG